MHSQHFKPSQAGLGQLVSFVTFKRRQLLGFTPFNIKERFHLKTPGRTGEKHQPVLLFVIHGGPAETQVANAV